MEKTKHMTEEEWIAIARDLYDKSDGTASLSGHPEGPAVEIVKTAKEIDLYFRLKQFDTERAFQQLKQSGYQSPATRRGIGQTRPVLKVAAAVVLALLVASAAFFVGTGKQDATRQSGVTVDQYGHSKIQLADGTMVTLNHDSKMNYPGRFDRDVREVSIEGEAFFEVHPDASRPFVIHAGDATINVLGTSFNVNAYPGNDEVEVVVETGKVRISKTKASTAVVREMILDPGERGTVKTAGGEMQKSRNDNPNFLAWKTRRFVFTKTSLKEVMAQLNKVYRVQVKASDPQLEKLLLTAHFEDRSLDFILKVISLTHDLKVEAVDDAYVLKD